jgi:uncharacterized protein YyaL (SSP411 family)
MPGHDQAALSVELLASDGQAAFNRIDPFARPTSGPSCAELEARFGVGNELLKNTQLGFYASVWPTFQALNYLAVRALLPGGAACSEDLAQTLAAVNTNDWDNSLAGFAPAYDQGPHPFHVASDLPRVDDSLWMGLATVQGYAQTGDTTLLRRAEAIFALAVANWDPREGGIYWEDHTTGATDNEKSVVSNAPAALLGVDLYRLTDRRAYLRWSERIAMWLEDHLLDHATGLYDDGLHDDGARVVRSRATYTYDQGIMIGVLAALSEVAPEQYPMHDAVDLAQRSIADFGSRRGSYGQPGFDVIFAENLLSLSRLDHNHSFDAAARGAVQLARRSEPKGNDLLTYSSSAALQALSTLPLADAGRLYFALPPSRPRGHRFDRGVAPAR